MSDNNEWWRGAVIYQVYPRSFQDSNGDGIGDLDGIRARLPYIASLGVDAVWIAPFFKSPMKDYGYDISDYLAIDPMFGSLQDFDHLLRVAHELELKIMIDLVLSHTSNIHPWFMESRSSEENPKSDWYVWAEPKDDGTPPNNWLSIFGGSAWQWDAKREQYYLHNFLSTQPDLNFHHNEVQQAVLDVATFWLERGVDGFRLDTINFYVHDKALRSNPALLPEERNTSTAPSVNPYNYQRHVYSKNRPENLEFLKKFRRLLDQYQGRTLLGEVGEAQRGLEILGMYTDGNDKVHMCYAFELLKEKILTATELADIFEKLDRVAQNSWACWAYSNHDVIRHSTRWNLSPAAQKMFTSLQMCIRGSISLYQGEELGFGESAVSFENLQDPYGIEFWPEYKGRDGCRTPMAWQSADSGVPHGGFTTGKPWLPIDEHHLAYALDKQENDTESMLHHYKKAISLRKRYVALQRGTQTKLQATLDVAWFMREYNNETLFCAFNMSEHTQSTTLPKGEWRSIADNLSGACATDAQTIILPPWHYVISQKM